MELFSEFKNIWLQTVYQIIRNMYENGKTYTENELFALLYLKEQPQAAPKVEEIIHILKILPPPSASFHLPPTPVTSIEKAWLKTMLQDEAVSFLLSPELRQKLLDLLQDIPALDTTHWNKDQLTSAIPDHTVLRTCYTALRQRTQLTWTTPDAWQHTGSPIRLEYDLVRNQYNLWLLEDYTTAPQRYALAALTDVTACATAIPETIETQWQDFLDQNQRSVCLQLNPKNNAVERCFRLFATYDKEATYDEALNTYHLLVRYYAFDKQDVIENILSLGNTVTVLEPQSLRDEIIAILKQAQERYQA